MWSIARREGKESLSVVIGCLFHSEDTRGAGGGPKMCTRWDSCLLLLHLPDFLFGFYHVQLCAFKEAAGSRDICSNILFPTATVHDVAFVWTDLIKSCICACQLNGSVVYKLKEISDPPMLQSRFDLFWSQFTLKGPTSYFFLFA